ncbi:hypothetical protein E5A71_13300 [Acinetobacter baumannii ATCC 17978]|nr:hypothetical protein E5A71_13300 [Acinetobacter baumannii ATCC 17978]QDQ60099.1 hypothetical protein E5A72_13445 [Acinetobacter baumannii ATCC 17978]QDQ67470.1 hypothetical protein E5A70_13320 [Acinetobacter baumannii ATCC 17978]UZK35302.1 hypothetical protein EAE94_12805 [Acinetobacter baumannii ATCC 17978]UZK39043.1 hypothetical protein EAV54_12810 [Acinetobacter baumannii ATCC 17978]
MCFGIKPNGNIPTINESSVVCGPIGCTVDFRCRLIHLKIILWNKPLEIGLCNKALLSCASCYQDAQLIQLLIIYLC